MKAERYLSITATEMDTLATLGRLRVGAQALLAIATWNLACLTVVLALGGDVRWWWMGVTCVSMGIYGFIDLRMVGALRDRIISQIRQESTK